MPDGEEIGKRLQETLAENELEIDPIGQFGVYCCDLVLK